MLVGNFDQTEAKGPVSRLLLQLEGGEIRPQENLLMDFAVI